MQRIPLILSIPVLFGILIWLTFFWKPAPDPELCDLTPALAAAPRGGDFTLESHLGPIALEDFRDRVVLLYFGYTWCPDICPTSLGLTSLALEALKPEELARVQSLFVSVDPERDNLERLKAYAEYFHEKILGITGSTEAIAEVAQLYGAAYRKIEQASATGYVVDHSAETYLINPRGELVEILPHGTQPELIVALIRKHLD
ncbi:MAG: SCO family protein [Gammaproteobacteria bacterium]|nr:SCO family protein [Gammaproteobacteria bacterium]